LIVNQPTTLTMELTVVFFGDTWHAHNALKDPTDLFNNSEIFDTALLSSSAGLAILMSAVV